MAEPMPPRNINGVETSRLKPKTKSPAKVPMTSGTTLLRIPWKIIAGIPSNRPSKPVTPLKWNKRFNKFGMTLKNPLLMDLTMFVMPPAISLTINATNCGNIKLFTNILFMVLMRSPTTLSGPNPNKVLKIELRIVGIIVRPTNNRCVLMTDLIVEIIVPKTALIASKTHLSCNPTAKIAGRITGAKASHFKPNGNNNPEITEPTNPIGKSMSGKPNEMSALKTTGKPFFSSELIVATEPAKNAGSQLSKLFPNRSNGKLMIDETMLFNPVPNNMAIGKPSKPVITGNAKPVPITAIAGNSRFAILGTKIFVRIVSGKLNIANIGDVKILIPVIAGIINNNPLRSAAPPTTGLTTVLITC